MVDGQGGWSLPRAKGHSSVRLHLPRPLPSTTSGPSLHTLGQRTTHQSNPRRSSFEARRTLRVHFLLPPTPHSTSHAMPPKKGGKKKAPDDDAHWSVLAVLSSLHCSSRKNVWMVGRNSRPSSPRPPLPSRQLDPTRRRNLDRLPSPRRALPTSRMTIFLSRKRTTVRVD